MNKNGMLVDMIQGFTVVQLKQVAKGFKVAGYSKMRKAELIAVLEPLMSVQEAVKPKKKIVLPESIVKMGHDVVAKHKPTKKKPVKKTSNVKAIEQKVKSNGHKLLGVYGKFEILSKTQMEDVLFMLGEEWSDQLFVVDGKTYVVELTCIEGEQGVRLMAGQVYRRSYGEMTWEDLLERYEDEMDIVKLKEA